MPSLVRSPEYKARKNKRHEERRKERPPDR